MCNLIMETTTGFGYLFIPGFLVISLLFFRDFNMGRLEKVKTGRNRLSRGSKY